MKNILVLGGAGYIGTHVCVELAASGYQPIVADLLTNSNPEAVQRVVSIIGHQVPFYKIDCTDEAALRDVFKKHKIDAVMHFAGHKAVGESVENPLKYYSNNLKIIFAITEVMKEFNVGKLIFSSSCTVYGKPQELPLRETTQTGLGITNPYGWTKFMAEQIFRDLATSDNFWQIAALRYFNPIGAHESGLIGEDPNGVPANILPFISQVAAGKLAKLKIFGDDYNTPDGTGQRDYVHVVDLAKGHVAALEYDFDGFEVYNLGTGSPTSVLDLIRAFEEATGKVVPYEVVNRRPGDIDAAYADVTKANAELNWVAGRSIKQACSDEWRWRTLNPNGYNLA